jgi:hypothetical protein
VSSIFAYDDGSANAPTGTPQHPTLLNTYKVRPSWSVAGVDYPVGPKYTPTKDPATINISGVDVNTSQKSIYLKGDNIKLDGYDFSLGGGWMINLGTYGTGVKDTIINCNFLLQPSQTSGCLIGGGGADLTVEYCTFDQTGPGANIPGGSAWSIISLSCSGTITFKYNWFKNFQQHVVEEGFSNGTSKANIVMKYNLIENGGLCPGAHLNYLQFGSGTFGPVACEFNTTWQPHTNPTGGEGFQFYNNGSGSVTGTCAYNTMIYGPGGEGGVHVPGGGYNGTTAMLVYNNYIDKKGGGGYFYPDPSAGVVDFYCGNVDMVTGAAALVTNAAGAQCPSPAVTITSPANNASVNGQVTVTGTAAQKIEVAGVAVSVDGGAYTLVSGTTAWSFALNASNLTNGTHTLRAKAWDQWKDTTLSAIVTITVNHGLTVTSPFNVSPLSSLKPHGRQDSRIIITDMKGRVIRMAAGDSWDGRDMQGARAEAGIYMYRIKSDGKTGWGKIFKQN